MKGLISSNVIRLEMAINSGPHQQDLDLPRRIQVYLALILRVRMTSTDLAESYMAREVPEQVIPMLVEL